MRAMLLPNKHCPRCDGGRVRLRVSGRWFVTGCVWRWQCDNFQVEELARRALQLVTIW